MIRINLLPIGRRPVEEKIRKEVSYFVLMVGFSLAVMGWFHVQHTNDIKRLTNDKQKMDSEIQRYQSRQKQLEKLKKRQKILRQKLQVIENLRKNRDLPVRVLNELAVRIPSDKMWIRTLTKKGRTLTLEGVARGNETIAQFMESLARSPYINANQVVLKQSRQVKIKGYKLKAFNLRCKITIPKPKQEGPKKKGKPRKAKSSRGGAA